MELCSDNLKNIIQQKPKIFGREESEPMKSDRVFHFVSNIQRAVGMRPILTRIKSTRNSRKSEDGKYFSQ